MKKSSYVAKTVSTTAESAPKQKRPQSKSQGKYKNSARYNNLKNFYLKGGFEDE